MKISKDKQHEGDHVTRVTRGELFFIFLRAGLAFGAGLGILPVLEEELVRKRRRWRREAVSDCCSNRCRESAPPFN